MGSSKIREFIDLNVSCVIHAVACNPLPRFGGMASLGPYPLDQSATACLVLHVFYLFILFKISTIKGEIAADRLPQRKK